MTNGVKHLKFCWVKVLYVEWFAFLFYTCHCRVTFESSGFTSALCFIVRTSTDSLTSSFSLRSSWNDTIESRVWWEKKSHVLFYLPHRVCVESGGATEHGPLVVCSTQVWEAAGLQGEHTLNTRFFLVLEILVNAWILMSCREKCLNFEHKCLKLLKIALAFSS